MTDTNVQNPPEVKAEAAEKPSVAATSAPTKVFAAAKHKRTLGEKTVDFLVYPLINNFVVIGTSVIATYLTKRGDTVGEEGSTIREVSSWFKRRGDWLQNVFQKHLNMSESSADMGKMVFFSFADGTALTPFVKLLEDRREKIARWVDQKFGDKNADDLVYKTEPKQTWGSVISGRLATLSIVLPTAVALDQKIGGRSLNDRVFDKPSEKVAGWLESHTKIKSRFPKLDTQFFSKTLVFEAVYASICTAGLYFISRAFVKNSKTHKERVEEYRSSKMQTEGKPTTSAAAYTPATRDEQETPTHHVSETTHMTRVAEPQGHEITA